MKLFFSSRTVITGCLFLLTLGSGCTSIQQGVQIEDPHQYQTQLKTKADVYKVFGMPSRIIHVEQDTHLIYNTLEGDGGGFGVGYGLALPILRTQRVHIGVDTYQFHLDSQDRVVKMMTMKGTEIVRSRIWAWD